MTQITGETIKSAIAINIRQNITLDTSYKIYKEKIVQGMSKPCFFIWTIDVSQEKLMFNNYERYYQMNVRFHTEEDTTKLYEKLCDLGNSLLECLATINIPITIRDTTGQSVDVNKPVKGTQMNFTITENVLQVFVTYRVKTVKQLLAPVVMEEMDINSNLKN